MDPANAPAPAEPAPNPDEAAAAAFDEELKQLWDWNMTNHTPTPDAIRKMEGLRSTAKAMKDAIIAMAPHTRERSLALTSLEQTLFYSVAAVARTENVDVGTTHADDTPEEDKALAAESDDQPTKQDEGEQPNV